MSKIKELFKQFTEINVDYEIGQTDGLFIMGIMCKRSVFISRITFNDSTNELFLYGDLENLYKLCNLKEKKEFIIYMEEKFNIDIDENKIY